MPNTTVKTQAADDTWLETARESKWLPGYIKRTKAEGFRKRRVSGIRTAGGNRVFAEENSEFRGESRWNEMFIPKEEVENEFST